MARLEAQEIEWLNGRFRRWLAESFRRPDELPADKAPTDDQLAAYQNSMDAYNRNPVRQIIEKLKGRYSQVAVKGYDNNGNLILDGNERDKSLFRREFEAFKKQRLGFAIEGAAFTLKDVITPPSLGMENLPGIVSNPGSILDMLNPMKWIGSLWDTVWKIAKQIPIVDDFFGAVKEVLSGRQFSMKNGAMRQAAERMFADLKEADRALAVNDVMSEYAASTGQLLPAPPGSQQPRSYAQGGFYQPNGTAPPPPNPTPPGRTVVFGQSPSPTIH